MARLNTYLEIIEFSCNNDHFASCPAQPHLSQHAGRREQRWGDVFFLWRSISNKPFSNSCEEEIALLRGPNILENDEIRRELLT